METDAEKKLGFPALTAMVIGSMVGAGIFMIPTRFAGVTGVYGSLIAWAIAGAGMLMLAFVFQALAVRQPTLNAGLFAYAKAGFGNYVGFTVAIGFWASACAGNVTYLVLIKSTIGQVIPMFGDGDTIPAIIGSSVLIWLYFILILRGTQGAAIINTIVTVAKVIPIITFIVLLIVHFDIDTFTSNLAGMYIDPPAPDPNFSPDIYENGSIVPDAAEPYTLFEQVSKTMMVTVFVFLGIEGASMYSRFAKTRKMVGSATVLGFISVLCLLIMVSVLPFGVLSQAEIAGMSQPSLAGLMQALIGTGGGIFISVGLMISVLGAYLAWSLMAAEVLFEAAKSNDTPIFLKKENKAGVPKNALILSAIMTNVILIATYFSEEALNFALDLTSALALLPFFLSALYALKIAIQKDGYDGIGSGIRTREIIVSAIATVYTLFLLYIAGIQFLPLCCLILAPATALYFRARSYQKLNIFTNGEKVVFGVLCAGFVIAIVGLATGFISL